MVINYALCDNCEHWARDHKVTGVCQVRTCDCPGFKPRGS